MNKKIVIILILAGLFSLSTVYAQDNVTSDNDVANYGNNENISVEPPKSFTDLNQLIKNNTGSHIYLNNSYAYDESIDSDFKDGIIINRPVNIIGNGYKIDASNSARIFNITSKDVFITRITFLNGNAENGGAITGDFYGIIRCTFIGNHADNYGGAMYNGHAENCLFKNNDALYGGAIYNGTSEKSNFEYNNATYGGAIYDTYAYDSTFTNNFALISSGAMEGSSANNCTFIRNSAKSYGAASKAALLNCQFINNSASNIGGAIGGHVGYADNCTFVNNYATNEGGAVYMTHVRNSEFRDNHANCGGAIAGNVNSVVNSKFINNYANEKGGALVNVYAQDCEFRENHAREGGAMYENSARNCTFISNYATETSGAIKGFAQECLFIDNSAYRAGAIEGDAKNSRFEQNHAVTGGAMYANSAENCIFLKNYADEGGAIYGGSAVLSTFVENHANTGGAMYNGSAVSCAFVENHANYGGAVFITERIVNCNFTGNKAVTGSAIYLDDSSSGTLTISNSCFLNNRANAEVLEVSKNEDNITITFKGGNNLLNAIYSANDAEVTFNNVTYWGKNGITTISSTIPGSNRESGQNITVGVVVNDVLVLNGVEVTDENGMIVLNISVGENYYIGVRHDTDSYYTEAEKTITKNTKFNVNVTSLTTNNRTVNITAKSNIPNNVVKGKLLFILPKGENITANYAANGNWWTVYKFDEYIDYKIDASYIGLDGVTINSAIINITDPNSIINLNDIILDYGKTNNVTVTTEGAIGITAKINNASVSVVNNYTIPISGLNVGNYTLTVTTIPDGDHYSVTKTVKVTVNKARAEISIANDILDVKVLNFISVGATLNPAVAGNLTYSSSNSSVAMVMDGVILPVGKGQAVITVSFNGNENCYAAENKTIAVIVSLYDANVIVDKSTLDLNVEDTYAINATIIPSTTIPAVVKLLNSVYSSSDESVVTVDANGIVTAVGEGNAVITVVVGDDVVFAKNSTEVNVTVKKLKTQITSSAITATYNVNKNLVVSLKDGNGNAVIGVSVYVGLNGVKTYSTDKNGQVIINVGILVPKTYNAIIAFVGNNKYHSSFVVVEVAVKKATPKITANVKTFKKSKKVKKYSITLKSGKTSINNVKVTIKIKKKIYTAKTNKKGVATFKIKKLTKKGNYVATVTYKGNSYYNKVSKKVKIKIK